MITADNAPEALDTLDANPTVALLMTDIVMPGGMSGVELAEAASARRPDLRVLLSTGYAGENLDAARDEAPTRHG